MVKPRPKLLWLNSLFKEINEKIMADLVRGYDVIYREIYPTDAVRAIYLIHQQRPEFVLLDNFVPLDVLASIYHHKPIWTTVLCHKLDALRQPIPGKYERLEGIDIKRSDWLTSTDSKLKEQAGVMQRERDEDDAQAIEDAEYWRMEYHPALQPLEKPKKASKRKRIFSETVLIKGRRIMVQYAAPTDESDNNDEEQ